VIAKSRKQFDATGLGLMSLHWNEREAEPDMPNRDTDTTDRYQPIDGATSATICKAIGDRLRQSLVPELSSLPPHLEHLLDRLRLLDGHPPADLQ
jgi:hypothetical protein